MSAIGEVPPQAVERDAQPYLHELVTVLAAPWLALSGPDGQVAGPGAAGAYAADVRVLSRLVATVDGVPAAAVAGQSTGTATARFAGVVRHLGDPGPDPTVMLERDRSVTPAGLRETVRLVSRARGPVRARVALELAADLAGIGAVKAGHPPASPVPPDTATPGLVRWPADPTGTDPSGPSGPAGLSRSAGSAGGVTARLSAVPDAVRVAGPDRDAAVVTVAWDVALDGRGEWAVTLELTAAGDRAPVVAPAGRVPWRAPAVAAGDHRLPALVERGVADLGGLLGADPRAPGDVFLTAGAPWYLTLFGRDSLWAARMALPLGTDLAAGTLRTLARRQGTRTDQVTAEEPGKIMHEVRPGAGGPAGTALYYGTVDATPLWVSVLHDAWRWGLPEAEVAALAPNLEAALGWLAARDGFVRYAAPPGAGLANQGWKDSHDSVQFADGTLATGPIALCEVQGYAYAAARAGADLLDALGRPGAGRWREWAAALRRRFRDRFWVEDPAGRYPAIALDGAGRPVDTVTSNIGHLLGTGLLDAAEEAAVVRRLAAPDMDCGFGLRTMSALAAGFNPLSYHGGSVWAHDTAIVLRGLATVGTGEARAAAASLAGGLLTAGAAFDARLPELYGGETAAGGRRPPAYPAACRPQAWSAAAALVVLTAVLGLEPDVPAGRVRLAPLRPSPVGGLTVRGLRVGGGPLDVRLSAAGDVEVLAAPAGLAVDVTGP